MRNAPLQFIQQPAKTQRFPARRSRACASFPSFSLYKYESKGGRKQTAPPLFPPSVHIFTRSYLHTSTRSMLRFLSRRAVLGALAALLIVAVSLVYFTGGAAPASARAAPSAAMWPGAGAWATSVLDTLTLKEKVSQLFSARAYGRFRSVDDPRYERLKKLAEDFGIGGFAFFQGHPMEQATLVNDLQESSDLPLLVSQDMEWGAGMRIEQTTTFPRAMALGATRDADLARAVGYATAHEARALGTQQVYAPVADVNNNPRNPIINVRSYGEKPGLVAEMTAAAVNGIQRGGAISTVKHFPGHGDTSTDSHVGLPVLTFGMERLQNLELVPFRTWRSRRWSRTPRFRPRCRRTSRAICCASRWATTA
ncbi:MAG: hypothetical protein BRD45_05905 [Bacteroidetes bacterium QS_8_64_10]|nr:MAG: hypothetical protein BRD45_05905 [Bacteroidetes bacterium QS_8_64_10]